MGFFLGNLGTLKTRATPTVIMIQKLTAVSDSQTGALQRGAVTKESNSGVIYF